ncbi:hypothetical protein F0U59_45450 [Archangium gephyra]|nr:hypothetical protein F0U59_45450 [Archangium gephyra]
MLRINEIAPGITGATSSLNGKDLVELLVVSGGTVDKFTLMQGATTTLATFPNVIVATGDIIVVHLRPAIDPVDAPASETTSKSEYPASTHSANYDSAWDFLGNTNEIGYSQRVIRVRDATGATQDGAAFFRTGGTPPADFYPQLQSLQAEGQWLPANCGGALCDGSSSPTGGDVSVNWAGLPNTKVTTIRRISATDTNTKGDWAVGLSSFGLPNP